MRYGIRLACLLAAWTWIGLSSGAASAMPIDDLRITIEDGNAHLIGQVAHSSGAGAVDVDIHFSGLQWTGDRYSTNSITGSFSGEMMDCSVAGEKGDCVFEMRMEDDNTLRLWTWLGDNNDLQILDLDAKLWAHRTEAPVPEPGAALLFAIGTAAVFRRQLRR
jgi:hypothetical protein